MLPSAGVCCLGSLNLTQFVKDGSFDFSSLKKYVKYMVRLLDNVNDRTKTPLKEYDDFVKNMRRIGVGVMGWGSALYMLKIPFASKEASELRDQIMETIAKEAYKYSIDLAEEKGMFPKCEPEQHIENKFVKNLDLSSVYIERLKKHGIRNSSLLSVQPTGTTGIFANVISGGIEPVFMTEYVRTVIVPSTPESIKDVTPKWYEGEWKETELFKFDKEGDEEILKGVAGDGTVYKIDQNRGLTKEVLCEDYGVRYLKQNKKWNPKAKYVKTTNDLSAQDHVNDLKGFAKWVDSSISKTISVPNDYPFEDFKDIYLDAYNTGYIKGLTTYRTGTMSAVLSAKDEKYVDDEEVIHENVKMPDSAQATLKTIRAEGRKWYLTVAYNENPNRPFALFVKTNTHEKNVVTNNALDVLCDYATQRGIPKEHVDDLQNKFSNDANSSKIARAISFLLRHGILIKNIVMQLDKVEDVYVGSFIFQIKKFLSTYIKDGEVVEDASCEACGGVVEYSEGCFKCRNCGSSKCG